MTAPTAHHTVYDPPYGLQWWVPLCAGCLAIVGAQAWREWRNLRGGGRLLRDVALRSVAAAAATALVTPWRGPNDVPGAGRVLALVLVLVGTAWWWPQRGGRGGG